MLLVDDRQERTRALQGQLEVLGHRVLAVCPSGQQACCLRRSIEPDLVLIACRLPDMDGRDAAREMVRHGHLPILLLADQEQEYAPAAGEQAEVYGYLPASLEPELLGLVLETAWQGIQRIGRLQEQVDGLKQSLAERKTIERAKGMVMEQLGLGADEALERLRREAASRGLSLPQMAAAVLANQGLHHASSD